MRAAAALLVLFVLAGCGGAAESAGSLGADAAELVPPEAIAFVSVDATSDGWKTVRELVGSGIEVTGVTSYALIDFGGDKPATIVLRKGGDAAARDSFPIPRRRAVYRQIGDWSVVAESEEAIDAVQRAQAGHSLADDKDFQAAMARLEGDALAVGYANDAGLQKLPEQLREFLGSPRWAAARAASDEDAVRLQVQLASPALPVYRPRLLRQVPSGAVLAVTFKNAAPLLKLVDLPALRGEGVLYVLPSALIPLVVLIVDSPTPADTARTLRAVAARIRKQTQGVLALRVITQGNRVVLTNGLGPAPTTGGLLVDDPPFKDALAAADAPEEVGWLAYADIQRLMPIVQPLGLELPNLKRAGMLVAFGTRSGLEARLTIR